MKRFKSQLTLATAVAATLSIFSTGAQAVDLIGINSSNQISLFSSTNIENAVFNTITGAAFGESFIGIDLRPSDNLVYGLTRSNNIYTIDAATGNSSFVAALSNPIIALGKSYGIDFNPVADRGTAASLRLISSTGDNYAINAKTGAVTVATSIANGFTGVSYTNSDTTTPNTAPTTTGLYYINSANDTLSFASAGFNNPTITTIGALNTDILSANGFDITADGVGYAAITLDDGLLKSKLVSINTTTGAATVLGTFNGTINGLTVAPVPEPETYAMLLAGLGLIGFSARCNKKSV